MNNKDYFFTNEYLNCFQITNDTMHIVICVIGFIVKLAIFSIGFDAFYIRISAILDIRGIDV